MSCRRSGSARLTRRDLLASVTAATASWALAGAGDKGRVQAAAWSWGQLNPLAARGLKWIDAMPWGTRITITDMPGDGWPARLHAAQQRLVAAGGGVVLFPPGEYRFDDSITIESGVILRGADPLQPDARQADFSPGTRFEFPQYEPSCSESGTPVERAFKGIYLADPAHASNCGLVNIAINRGHIRFAEADDHKSGVNRLVCGCLITNAAVADPRVPDLALGQHAWQRFTQRHAAAIHIHAGANVLVANNRLAPATDDFVMPGYLVRSRDRRKRELVTYDIVFDFDNRPGISVNDFCIGAAGGGEPSGTPESHPWGFRQGIVIRDNYIFSSGRTAIAFTGDGTVCAGNVVRFKEDVWRPTNTGLDETSGSSTNDNRAVQMRGYRWKVEGNDYEVFRNWAADHKYYINDGEGLMHENHCNSAIRDSVLRGNRGNAYLSLYKTGLIDGLLIADNDISVPARRDPKQAGINRAVAIFVDADHDLRAGRRGKCQNVSITGNCTVGGILLGGDPSSNNLIQGNRDQRGDAIMDLRITDVALAENHGYQVVRQLPEAK